MAQVKELRVLNSLIIYQSEFIDAALVRVGPERSQSLWKAYRDLVGQTVRVAVFGAGRGSAFVREASTEHLLLEVACLEPSLPLRPIDLIVGLSRPQTVKKVIQVAVMTGVRSLSLVRTQLGEKSYVTSHLLEEDYLRDEVVKALEQIGEGVAPTITVHRSFSHFCQNRLGSLFIAESPLKILAHPGGVPLNSVGGVRDSVEAALAVGPEPGWSDDEKNAFEQHGFLQVGLGPRVVRVEVALSLLLGQLQALSRL